MRILLIVAAALMIAGAAWAAIDAREAEETARIRHTICIQRYGFSAAACPWERRWDTDRLVIAVALGVGGVLALGTSRLLKGR